MGKCISREKPETVDAAAPSSVVQFEDASPLRKPSPEPSESFGFDDLDEIELSDEVCTHCHRPIPTFHLKYDQVSFGKTLGAGFFGEVRMVFKKGTNETFVSKQLHLQNTHSRKVFLKEACLMREFEHDNLLKFLGLMTNGMELFLMTEYIDSGTLAEWILDEFKEFSWNQRLSCALQIALGMDHLHAVGIIHRDLTSHNCLIDSSGRTVVADFGLARFMDEGCMSISSSRPSTKSRTTRTVSSGNSDSGVFETHGMLPGIRTRASSFLKKTRKNMTIVGSPFWMSPEMMNSKPYDQQTDVFSFGIILCQLLGRVSADPEQLPRLDSFGVDWNEFDEVLDPDRSDLLYSTSVACTQMSPSIRPPFEDVVETLRRHFLEVKA